MIGTSYIPLPPWALLFGFAPLWIAALKSQSLRQALLLGWVTQFILTLIGFHWIEYLAREFGHIPVGLSHLTLIGFAIIAHWYIPAATALGFWLYRKWGLSFPSCLFAMAIATNLGEGFWPVIFRWHLGYTLLPTGLGINQTAEWIGYLGLSQVLLLTNAALAWWAYSYPNNKPMAPGPTIAVLLSLLSLLGLELLGRRLYERALRTESFPVRIGFTQGNIGNFEKVYAERGLGFQKEIIDRYFNLSRSFASQVDLWIWPETAIPTALDQAFRDRFFTTYFISRLPELGVPLITGAYGRSVEENSSKDYNALFFLNPDGSEIGHYRKTQLLVFGEYVPLGETFTFLKKLNPGGEGFARGKGPTVFQSPDSKKLPRIGPQICYESLDPFFSTELARKGAQMIVNLTNDSWFGPGFEPLQHMYMTLARAIEVRLPLVRSTNTGITTAIQFSGKIENFSPLFKEWVGQVEALIPTDPKLTVYARFGHWIPLIQLFILFLIMGFRRSEKVC
jgi:apolipoprotein N-acyltransferase